MIHLQATMKILLVEQGLTIAKTKYNRSQGHASVTILSAKQFSIINTDLTWGIWFHITGTSTHSST